MASDFGEIMKAATKSVAAKQAAAKKPPGPTYDDRPDKPTDALSVWNEGHIAPPTVVKKAQKKMTVKRRQSGAYVKGGADPIPLTPVTPRPVPKSYYT